MGKVKCGICSNEVGGFCKIKKSSVRLNKSRRCEAFVLDKARLSTKEKIPVTRLGYAEMEENRKRLKAELKELRKALKAKPNQGTAQDLGLVSSDVAPGYKQTTSGLVVPTSTKHPLTGDLSRFVTSASKSNDEDKNED